MTDYALVPAPDNEWSTRLTFILKHSFGSVKDLANYEVYTKLVGSAELFRCPCGAAALWMGVNIIQDYCDDCFAGLQVMEAMIR